MTTDQTTAASGGDEGALWIRALRDVHQDCTSKHCEHRLLLDALDAARAERDQAREAFQAAVKMYRRALEQARTEARQWRERAERAEAAMPADESDDGWTATAAERESFERIAAVLAATPAATGDDKGHGVYTCDVAYCDTHGTVR